ncbi:hypothetical protein [Bradyrhizobium sp. CCBAU 53421]|uniref:hypothetical protein n=1 Tax=Bradyrhizobium sp. CCBAU 53421 TaxID=1325120 RepID=UPI00188B67C7|nr:hypothetical protein [Bradyrhizobium sp. CCBAU 53421]QOZ32855.1 hypothetical protein XH92_15180 [Bradyrhizobium sp. CCBAU 53421]
MPHDSTDQIAMCRELADEADRRASTSGHETARKDYELLAQSWQRLALSYQFSSHLERFLRSDRATQRQSRITRPKWC